MGSNAYSTAGVEASLELARDVAAALATLDPHAVERCFHPDVEFHDAWALGAGVYRGHEGIRELFEDVASAWHDFSFEVAELEPTPDGRVFMTARERVRRKAGTRELDRTMYFVLAFRDGQLVRWDGWHLRAVARDATGLAG